MGRHPADRALPIATAGRGNRDTWQNSLALPWANDEILQPVSSAGGVPPDQWGKKLSRSWCGFLPVLSPVGGAPQVRGPAFRASPVVGGERESPAPRRAGGSARGC